MPEVVGVIHESKSEVANARSLWLLAQMNVELLAAIEENDATPWGGMDRVKRNLAELEDAELHVRAVVASHP